MQGTAEHEWAKELRPVLSDQRRIVPFHIVDPPPQAPMTRAVSSAEEPVGEGEAEWERAVKRRAVSALTSSRRERSLRHQRGAHQSLILDFFPSA